MVNPADDGEIEHWILEARNGSAVALGHLLSFYHKFLLRLARRNISEPLRAKFDPADLVQVTALEAHRQFRDFRGNTRHELKSWLRRILLHQATDAARFYRLTKKRMVSSESPLADHPEIILSLGIRQLSPEDETVQRERIARLQIVVQLLPPRMREAFVLRTYQHLAFREIGRQLGCSSEAARKLYGRAASRIRRKLAE